MIDKIVLYNIQEHTNALFIFLQHTYKLKMNTKNSIPEEQKIKNKGPRGPVVKQFEWFQMQTRLRKIIQEIINPIQTEIVRNSSHIQKLQKNHLTFNDQIHLMLRMTTNDPEVFQKGVFKKVQQKFQAQQKTLTFLQQQVKNNTTFIDKKISLIDERMKESNDMITQVQQLKTSNRQNLKQQTEKFDAVRKNIDGNIQKLSEGLELYQKNNLEKIQKLEKKLAQNQMGLENITKQFEKVKSYFDRQKSVNEDLIAQQIKLQEETKNLDSKILQSNKKIKQLAKLKPFIQDMQIDFQKVVFKVDNIVPLINQAQINELLYRILPPKFHPRIAVYQFQRYNDLNQKVLSRNFQTNPACLNFNGEEMIRQSQQRNTKLLTKLKLNYYKKSGVDLDYITFQERERRLTTQFDYAKLCEIIDELQQFENEKIDRKKNHRLTQEDVVNLVRKQIEIQKAQLITKIQTEIGDNKIYLQSSSQVLQNTIDKIQSRIQKLSENFNHQKVAYQLFIKHLEQNQLYAHHQSSKHSDKLSILYNFSKEVSGYLRDVYENIKSFRRLAKNAQCEVVKLSSCTVKERNNSQNEKYKEKSKSTLKNQKIKEKLGVIIMSDSEENYNTSRIIHEKQHDSSPETYDYEKQAAKKIQKIKETLLQYSIIDEKQQIQVPQKFKSNLSKLTRPSEGQIKYKSQSSFDPLRKNSNSFNDLNHSSSIYKSSQKNEGNGFLNIPQFKDAGGTRICKQHYTTRLSMRKKPTLKNPRASFFQSQEHIPKNRSKDLQETLGYFRELNSLYLK